MFDLDGTLADNMALAPRAYAETVRCLGGPQITPDEVVAAWHIGPTPVVLEHFLRRAVAPPDIERFYASFGSVLGAVQPFPGTPAMLSSLLGKGYRLGVFTQATRRAATMTLEATGLGRFQLTLVGGDEIAEPKPAARGLLLACRRINAAPSATAYVGDAEVDLQCAAVAGSLGVHACWGATGAIAGPHLTAWHPRDVAGLLATHQADFPEAPTSSGAT